MCLTVNLPRVTWSAVAAVPRCQAASLAGRAGRVGRRAGAAKAQPGAVPSRRAAHRGRVRHPVAVGLAVPRREAEVHRHPRAWVDLREGAGRRQADPGDICFASQPAAVLLL